MKLIRKGLALGVCAAAATIAACSSHHGPTGSSGSGSDQTATLGQGGLGSIGMHLTLSNNDSIYSISYTCTGPGTIPPGTIDFNDAQSIEKVIGGIPDGNGYVCTLTGFDTLGDPCNGTTTSFNISAGQVSSATALITCTQASDAAIAADVTTGSVAIDAGIQLVAAGANNCPGITSFSFSPAEVIGAQNSQLALSETGPQGLTSTGGALDAGAGITNILWTSSCAAGTGTLCGSFDGAATSSSPSPSFQCAGGSSPFQVTITAQVTNYETSQTPSGPVTTNVCNGVPYTSMTSLINCEGGGSCSCFNPTPNNCATDGSCMCVSFANDVNNCGSCGHVCATGNTCVSGACVAPPPTACTSSPCSPSGSNSVQCTGNTGQTVCTPTEAVIVGRDIARGLLSGGQLTAGSCYACLVSTGCIDGGGFGGNECGDLSGTVGTGAASASTKTAACLSTLSCILPTTAATCGGTNASTGISNCFCGTNGATSSACTGLANFVEPPSGSGPNGACDTLEFDGFGYVSGVPNNTTVLGAFTTNTTASGMANAILSCAGTNSGSLASCPQCFQ